MKIKTIKQHIDEKNEDFDIRVNDFIKDKQVVQITTNDVISTGNFYMHTLTILYKEGEQMTKDEYVKILQKEEDDNAQEAEDNGYGSGYYDGLDYAVYLAEKLDEPSAQKTSDIEIKNNLSYAGYADLAYNERVINGIESVLIRLGYEVEDD